jgi:hypothetical protein
MARTGPKYLGVFNDVSNYPYLFVSCRVSLSFIYLLFFSFFIWLGVYRLTQGAKLVKIAKRILTFFVPVLRSIFSPMNRPNLSGFKLSVFDFNSCSKRQVPGDAGMGLGRGGATYIFMYYTQRISVCFSLVWILICLNSNRNARPLSELLLRQKQIGKDLNGRWQIDELGNKFVNMEHATVDTIM